MDPLPLWSTDAEIGSVTPGAPHAPGGEHDHTELDNISPSLIVSSLSDIHANYLLDDLNLPEDYTLEDCTGRGTLALDYAPPPPPSVERQHSHGPYPCSFSSDECPLNPFSEDPVFGDDPLLMTPETAVTLRSAATTKPRVSSPDTPTRPVGRRPPRMVSKSGGVAAGTGAGLLRDPPPYPGLTSQERTDHTAFYSVAPVSARRALGLAERSVPRLKVVRRVTSPALARHNTPAFSVASPPPATTTGTAAARRPAGRQTSVAGQTESKHTKPSLSYVNLITLALLNSETGSLRCNEIYDFLQRMFPYFREVGSKTWKNDTRHALSSNQSSSNFCKAPESKDTSSVANRGALWMAKPEKVQFLHEHLSKTYCKFADNIKESMDNPELYGELLRGIALYSGGLLDPGSPCDQSPTVGSTTDSPDEA